jgi:type IV secretion system protein VirB9
MRICTVELQAGEDLTQAPLVADRDSWSVTSYSYGDGAARRVEVGVKPLLCGVASNMVIPTTRRRYELSLLSAPCRAVEDWDANAVYTRRVRWTYPEDAQWQAAQERAALAAAARESSERAAVTPATRDSGRAAPQSAGPVRNAGYSWRRSGGFPWEPVEVWDDGAHTYIRVPPEARQHELPILYVVDASGQRTLLNYEPPQATGTFKTDRVVPHLALVIGADRGAKVLHIYNRRMGGR